jgi:hypothetical protein
MKNMKTFFTKNTAIVILVSSNLMAFAYISANKSEIEPRPKVKVRPAKGSVEGKALLKNDEKLQLCYHRYLETQPEIDQGTVQLHMTIKNTGEIDYLKLAKSDMPNEEFNNCILAEVGTRRLEPTRARLGVLISHKFNFSRRNVSSVDY